MRDDTSVVAPTPAAVQHAFAAHGLRTVREARAPELCTRKMCLSLDVWGGGRVVYLAPPTLPGFFVVLFPAVADARRMARLEERSPGVGAVRRGSLVLVYLRPTALLSRLLAALRSIH